MASEIFIQYKRVVEQIFSNWTALQLAVEHSMGGPSSRQLAIQTIDHICNYCISTNDIQVEDIQDELEDILDEEFNTICEENSPYDVAQVMWRFLQILKQGNFDQFQIECNNLPPLKNWLSIPAAAVVIVQREESSDDDDEGEASMEVDPEWTVVKSKKKK